MRWVMGEVGAGSGVYGMGRGIGIMRGMRWGYGGGGFVCCVFRRSDTLR